MVNQINDVPGTQHLNITEKGAQKQTPAASQEPSAANKPQQDSVQLSDRAQQLDAIKQVIDATPDIDTNKVNAIKDALDAGELNIDANALAKKMLELESM